jgi:uncharacterized protein YqgV (UPF0045/DUF77 family)
VGTGNVSVAKEVAEVQKVLKASGLAYTLHSAGTTVGMLKPVSTVNRSRAVSLQTLTMLSQQKADGTRS